MLFFLLAISYKAPSALTVQSHNVRGVSVFSLLFEVADKSFKVADRKPDVSTKGVL